MTRRRRRLYGYLVAFILLTALVLPKSFIPEYSFELGKVWVAPTLKAEFDFTIAIPPDELEVKREQARERVPLVFKEREGIRDAVKLRIQTATDSLTTLLREDYKELTDNAEALRQFRRNFTLRYDFDARDFLTSIGGVNRLNSTIADVYPKIDAFIDKVYEVGLIDTLKESLRIPVVYVQETETTMKQTALILEQNELGEFLNAENTGISLTRPERLVFSSIVLPNLLPNLRFSPQLTDRERQMASRNVSPVEGKVKRGEQIIAEGEQVGEKEFRVLNAYMQARLERFGTRPFWLTMVGQVQIVFILTLLLTIFLRLNRPRIWANERKLLLVLTLILLMVSVLVLVLKLTTFSVQISGLNYIYLAPVCMVPIILSIFFDARLAFFGNLLVALFAGSIVPNGFEYVFVQLCAGTTATYSIIRLRNRGDFFVSLGLVLLTYCIAYVSYNFYLKGDFYAITYGNLVLFGLNILLTIITYPLIYLFEKLFDLNSDFTFLELLDTNHPLLADLAVRAPGTYQHSLQVANIAEAVINKIGGNSLMIKVGAYFHDIGKMKNPEFFIENQSDGENPHDQLSPKESAKIIIGHRSEGVRMARKANLPTELVDFIKTHHGTTLVSYFYNQYLNDHPEEEVDIDEFSYPGPLPFTKEMGVLMMADSVEAAARSLKEPTPEKLRTLVDKIIDGKMSMGQFTRSELTFKNVEDAKEVMFRMLMSMYHTRIEYPEADRRSGGKEEIARPIN